MWFEHFFKKNNYKSLSKNQLLILKERNHQVSAYILPISRNTFSMAPSWDVPLKLRLFKEYLINGCTMCLEMKQKNNDHK